MDEKTCTGYFALTIIIIVFVIVLVWWVLNVYNARYPGPGVPSADYKRLITEYESYPKELWFENDKKAFDKWLACRPYRFIVYESNGKVVYDSVDRKKWKYRFPYNENAEQLTSSVEYGRAVVTTQGVVTRKVGCHKIANLAELAKIGDYYRIVHVSEYVYNTIL